MHKTMEGRKGHNSVFSSIYIFVFIIFVTFFIIFI